MRYVTRPLTPAARARLATTRPKRSPFDAPWFRTLELLDRELSALGVRGEFVLQIDCSEADLRLDGQLRANARPASPAVAIAIEARKGPLLFACNRFDRWQDNLRDRPLSRHGKAYSYANCPGCALAYRREVVRRSAAGLFGHPDWEQLEMAFSAAATSTCEPDAEAVPGG